MRVAGEVKTEMADVVGGVDGLRLRAQHHLVDKIGDGHGPGALQHLVEVPGPQRPSAGQLQVQAVEELAQGRELLLRGSIVDPIDHGRAPGLQRLRDGHVGLDHELLDQPMRVEALQAR